MFSFPLETCEQCSFFSENFAVTVVARAFEYIFAITLVLSIAYGSVLHCVT